MESYRFTCRKGTLILHKLEQVSFIIKLQFCAFSLYNDLIKFNFPFPVPFNYLFV